jgi:hypothetical protein
MNGPTTKIVPEINLDEFERRLRSTGAPPEAVEDPLAELTRLVDMISQDGGAPQKAGQPAPHAGAAPQVPRVERAEALLPRASQYEDAPAYAQSEPLNLSHDERADLLAAAAEAQAPAGRARGWYLKTAGLAVVGVVLFGGAAAMKLGVAPGVTKAPPFIAAAEGPTKIQPPNDSTVQSAGDAGALLMKDSATSAPVKVVSNDEQPVDLHAQAPSPAAATPAPTQAATAASPTPTDSSPVAPSTDTPIVAPGEATATVAPLFPDAKPVKTVSVRPDGTLISSDASAPASPPSAKTATRVADNSSAGSPPSDAAPQPATPKLDLPTKLSPKSSARVAKTDTTAPADATETTPKPPAAAKPATRSVKAPPAAGDQVADAAASDAPAASEKSAGGGWVVQLSAPRTETDAQSEIRRLKNKYADTLGGADIGIHKAEIKGETIYRVRASGYSKADAAALCAKLKGAGGDCFITRN